MFCLSYWLLLFRLSLFLFVSAFPQDFLPFFPFIYPTLCVSVWWLPGCPMASPSLSPLFSSPFSPEPRFFLLLILSAHQLCPFLYCLAIGCSAFY